MGHGSVGEECLLSIHVAFLHLVKEGSLLLGVHHGLGVHRLIRLRTPAHHADVWIELARKRWVAAHELHGHRLTLLLVVGEHLLLLGRHVLEHLGPHHHCGVRIAHECVRWEVAVVDLAEHAGCRIHSGLILSHILSLAHER